MIQECAQLRLNEQLCLGNNQAVSVAAVFPSGAFDCLSRIPLNHPTGHVGPDTLSCHADRMTGVMVMPVIFRR